MDSTPPLTFTPENVSQVIQELQAQLAVANNQLNVNQQQLLQVQTELNSLRQNNHQSSTSNVKPNKPNPFKGKGSVLSWTTHMTNYLRHVEESEALAIAVSYLYEGAHEWWIAFAETDEGKNVRSWTDLKNALVSRFDTINKEKIARDKLAKWRQIKDVATFNDDFQRIVLEIPNISMAEQIDRYTRGLKSHIWKELCTKDCVKLSDAMKDAERVEAAHRRGGMVKSKTSGKSESSNKPTPMEIGNIQLEKLSKQERDRCMKEGLCLRCRESGHLARNCPKGRKN